MNYESIADSREAFEEISVLLGNSDSDTMRFTVETSMRALILTLSKYGTITVPAPVRAVRKLAIELLKLSTRNNLNLCLKPTDLDYLDLWNMNFAFDRLAGFSFRTAFLVESTFESSDLSGACFNKASIRSVNFTNANLAGADFTDADWFNAIGLNEHQLCSTRPETLMRCPSERDAMHTLLTARYSLPFNAWAEPVREEILQAWSEYLRPGGLRDFVDKIRRHPSSS